VTPTDVSSVDQIEPVIRASPPGRCQIDEISADPLPLGDASKLRVVGIKRDDGSVAIEPESWEA
jgi:hypothetical protein